MTRPKILVTSAAGRTGSAYVEIPTEVWLEQIAKARFMNPHFLKHLEQVAAAVRDGFFGGVTDVVEKIGGRTPKSLETFVREH